jgi:c-di-AMP phosphodiesterase-like protein
MVCVMMMSKSWILVSAGMALTFLSFSVWLTVVCDLYMGVVAAQFSMVYVVLTVLSYIIERQLKLEFVQSSENNSLKQEFRQMLDVVPEGILIYDQAENGNQRVLIANNEMLRIALEGHKQGKIESVQANPEV